MLTTLCQILGALLLAHIGYRIAACIYLYCLQSSAIDKYVRKDGKAYALVTGASDGVGLELVKILPKLGFNVILHGRSEEKLARITDQLRSMFPAKDILYVAADARDPKIAVPKIAAVVGKIEGRGGKLTILVNNVGGQGLFNEPTFSFFTEMSLDSITACIQLNGLLPIQLTKVLYSSLLKSCDNDNPGLVLNVGSYSGEYPAPMGTVYGPTKAMLHHFTRAMAAENAMIDQPVEVLCVLLGAVKTLGNVGAAELSFAVLSPERMAQSIIDRVGCGYTVVTADWRHCVSAEIGKFVPEWVFRALMRATIETMRDKERELLEKAK